MGYLVKKKKKGNDLLLKPTLVPKVTSETHEEAELEEGTLPPAG